MGQNVGPPTGAISAMARNPCRSYEDRLRDAAGPSVLSDGVEPAPTGGTQGVARGGRAYAMEARSRRCRQGAVTRSTARGSCSKAVDRGGGAHTMC
jgi:hypothetical protein